MINLHLCCNQCCGRWEVRDHNESILFYGTLDKAEQFKDNNKDITEAQRDALNQDCKTRLLNSLVMELINALDIAEDEKELFTKEYTDQIKTNDKTSLLDYLKSIKQYGLYNKVNLFNY